MKLISSELLYKREIKSYVLRSRMTASQKFGFDHFWSVFGLEILDKKLDIPSIFSRSGPTILEIGFGMGGSLIQLAETHPMINFLGIEVHKPGVGALLSAINDKKLENIRVFCANAVEVLEKSIPDNTLSGVLLFFPDPWPKRRHHKRRIVQLPFVNLIHQKLLSNGYFHLATDVKQYAHAMMAVMKNQPGFTIMKTPEEISCYLERPKTKFERRGENLGHIITDLIYRKR